MTRRYGGLEASHLDDTANLIATSFGVTPGDERGWLANAGHDNIRVLRDDGRPSAALIQIPMGQFFGGRSVPMVGIAGVACRAEQRGTGAATELMKRNVRELHGQGVALSGLYPAVQSLYRRAGYELAGTRYEGCANARDLGDGDRTLEVRPYEDADQPAVEKVYGADARHRSGYLDRGPYVWQRVRNDRFERVLGYVVIEDGVVAGYVFFTQPKQRGDHLFMEAQVQCLAARTERTRRRLLTLLGDLRSLTDDVFFYGAAHDERLAGVEERRYRIRVECLYMLRVVHVAAALEARGYSKAVRGELHLDIRDSVVRHNAGRYRLSVEGGRAEVKAGGRGTLRLDVRNLAQLYTGFASAHALESRGALEGTRTAIDLASGIFAGPEPVLQDMF